MDTAILIGMFIILGYLLVLLNIHEYRRRRALSPEERRREDEEDATEMRIW